MSDPADDARPTPELARSKSRRGLVRSMTRSRGVARSPPSAPPMTPATPSDAKKESLAEMAPGLLGDQVDMAHRSSEAAPVTGAGAEEEILAFHGDQPLLVLTDTDGRAEGGEGDAMFSAIEKVRGGDGRTVVYLNSEGGQETVDFNRLSQVVLPWDPKLKKSANVLLRDVRVMQHLKERLEAMEAGRTEMEMQLGPGAVEQAVKHSELLAKKVERAEGALENAEKWSKSLREMKDKEKEREKAAAAADPAATPAPSKFDPSTLFGGGPTDFKPKFDKKGGDEDKPLSLRWAQLEDETRPTQGRELKNAQLSKELRRGKRLFSDVSELGEFEHHGHVVKPSEVRADDFVLAGTWWFAPAPPPLGLNWIQLDERPAHGRELKNTKASSALIASLAGGKTSFREDELDAMGLMQKDLRDDDYVSAGGSWYTPAEQSKLKVTEKGRAKLWMHLAAWKAHVDKLALEDILQDSKVRALQEGVMPKVKQQILMVKPLLQDMGAILVDLGKIDTDLIRLQMLRDISFDELKDREKQLKAVEHWMKTYKDWVEVELPAEGAEVKMVAKQPTEKALSNIEKHLEKVYDTFGALQKLAEHVTVDLLEDLAEASLKKCGAAGLRRYHPGQALVVRKDRRRGARWLEATVRSSDASGKHKLKATSGAFFSNFSLVLHPWNHSPQVLRMSSFNILLSWYVRSLAEEHSTVLDPVLGDRLDVIASSAAVTLIVETTGDKSKDDTMREDAKKAIEEAEAEAEKEKEMMLKGKKIKKKKREKEKPVEDIVDVKDAASLSTWLRVMHDNLGKGHAIAGPVMTDKTEKHFKSLRTKARVSEFGTAEAEDESESVKKPTASYKDEAVGQGTLILLTAPSSSGKTFLLHQLVMMELNRDGNVNAASAGELVPIVVKVKLLARKMANDDTGTFVSAWNWIDAYLKLEYGEDSELYLMLRQAMMARRALLLLDGLDEGGDKRMLIERHLIEIVAPQGHTMVVTSRPRGYTDFIFSGFPHLSIKPLSEEQQVEYLTMRLGDHFEEALNFHADADLERLPDKLLTEEEEEQETEESIRGRPEPEKELVTSNPLVLSMVASTFIMTHAKGGELPSAISEVYYLACSAIIDGIVQSDAFGHSSAQMLEALIEAVFLEGHMSGKREITLDELEKAVQSVAPGTDPNELQNLIYAFDSSLVQGQMPFFGVLQDRPLRLEAAYPALQEYYVAQAVCKQRALLTTQPWKFRRWWSNVLTLGAEMGDDFGQGLFHAVGFAADEVRELDLKQKINGHRETALRAVAQMGRAAKFLSLSRNAIKAREMATLMDVTMPELRYLELAYNEIGVDYYGQPLGARWTKHAKKPAFEEGGTLMVCEALSKTLQSGKLQFTIDELDGYDIKDFKMGNFIKDSRKPPGFYTPSPEILPGPPNEGMPPLANAISEGRLPRLKGLELRGNYISEDAIALLSRAICNGKAPHLVSVITDKFEVNDERDTYISFANANLNNEDLSIITELLKNGALPNCTMFNLLGNDFTQDAAEKLVEVLQRPTFLRWTALQDKPSSGVEIVDDPVLRSALGAGYVVFTRPEVERMKSLGEVSWDCWTHAPPEKEAEKNLFGGGGPPEYFMPEQTRRVFSLLPQVQLQDGRALTYKSQMLTDVDLYLLSESVRSAKVLESLQSIELGGNRITTRGFAYLVSVLEQVEVPNLTTLSLPKNKITDDGLQVLSLALARGAFTTVENLILHDNPYGDAGLNYLIDAVVKQGGLAQVRTLLLGGKAKLTTETVAKLAEMLSAVEEGAKSRNGTPTYWAALNKLSVLDHSGTAIADACERRDVELVQSDGALRA